MRPSSDARERYRVSSVLCPTVTGMPVADSGLSIPSPALDDALVKLPSLSPSRAADFKTCPLLYRFRTIDRIPEPPTFDQARGTLVHAVLEKLFDLPAAQRPHSQAAAMVEPQWDRLREDQPLLAELFGEETPADFVASTVDLLAGY